MIVDALLGTGIRGQVRPRALELIRLVNEYRRGAVVAVDVPSGADTDTGALLPDAIRADWTVTFAYPKWCHYLRPAAEYCGEVIVADIGIPRSAAEHRPPGSPCQRPVLVEGVAGSPFPLVPQGNIRTSVGRRRIAGDAGRRRPRGDGGSPHRCGAFDGGRTRRPGTDPRRQGDGCAGMGMAG